MLRPKGNSGWLVDLLTTQLTRVRIFVLGSKKLNYCEFPSIGMDNDDIKYITMGSGDPMGRFFFFATSMVK